MRIAIDISPLASQKRVGIENYIFNLCKNLPLIDKENTYIILANSYGHYQSLRLAAEEIGVRNHRNMSAWISRMPRTVMELLWKYVHVPSPEWLAGAMDIFHGGDWGIPPLKSAKLIITLFDITPIKFKEYHRGKIIRHYINDLPQALQQANIVITASQCSKEDILEYFGAVITEDRIRVIPLAANERYRQIDNQDLINNVKNSYGIDRHYILFVGTLEPRKNIVSLIRAYSILPDYLKHDHLLVICGKKGWYFGEIFMMVEELGLEDKIVFTDYVPDEDVPLLMNGAKIFVYPSFYEGFGLPPLEAMACGTPVISSNVSSLPEVVWDAGILVNPKDVEELSDAIQEVLVNDQLRTQLSEKGLMQASKFSWQKTTEKTVGIYNEISL